MATVLLGFGACAAVAQKSVDPIGKRATAKFAGIPLSFEANQGQTDPQVKFLSRGDGYSLFLTSNAAVLKLRTPAGLDAAPSFLRMELLGAASDAQMNGVDQLPGVVNYFIGNDPKRWHANIETYAKVKYRSIYPGVDAVFYGNQTQLEYDFVVAPGADPSQIALGLSGVAPALDPSGNVVLATAGGDLLLCKPVVYQGAEDNKKVVEASYVVSGSQVRFKVGKYDPTQPLVIDPKFDYMTYLGGSGSDMVGSIYSGYTGYGPYTNALVIDASGNTYVAGITLSANFPTQDGYEDAWTGSNGNNWTAFVSKINPTGTGLVYSTYLGGSVAATDQEFANAIAVDASGDAYVVGQTQSQDFPVTTGAFQTHLPGSYSAFVTKLNPAGNGLVYSTFLGGSGTQGAFGIALDANDQAYVTGGVNCNCAPPSSGTPFPVTSNALLSTANNFSYSGFITVFNAAGTSLLYSSLIGDDQAQQNWTNTEGVAVDPGGNFYVTGMTQSPNMPVTSGAFQTTMTPLTNPGYLGPAAFAAKFGPVSGTGNLLTYLTYLEGTPTHYADYGTAITADSEGNAYMAGYTLSTTFPATAGAYQTTCPDTVLYCAFVTKLNPTGTALVWSTLLSGATCTDSGCGSVDQSAVSIAVDVLGNVYVAGQAAGGFPSVNPVQPNLNTDASGFITKIDPTGSTLLFSSMLGDPATGTWVNGVAVDALGNVYVGGGVGNGTGIPVTAGAFQPTFGGGQWDGWVAKIGFLPSTIDLEVSPSTATVGQTVTFTGTVTGAADSPTPTGTVTFYNGATVLGTTTLNSSGVGMFSTASLAPGDYSVTASYGSDGNYGLSTSVAQSLTINAPQVAVPNVVGDTEAAAATAITGVGLDVGTETLVSSPTVASGDVISEIPSAGTNVNVGSAVNLFVSTGPAKVSVPNVVGDTQAAATTAITGAGLTVGTVTSQPSGAVASGDVISETPSAGTSVNVGSAVNLVVSTGPAKVSIPNVVGDTQAAATTALTGAGLTVGTVTSQSSAAVANGDVISETPSAGTSVNSGSAVNLVVSTGPAKVIVPNVVGDTRVPATTALTGAGLVLGTVTQVASNIVASGAVISQTPSAGASVNPGSAVNVVVSTGPAKVAVPSVVGDTQAAATTAITGAGLTVGSVTTAASCAVPPGDVISENPTAGTSVAVGSAVNLVLPTVGKVAVPNVVGDTQAAATTAITNAVLLVGLVSTTASNVVPAGDVISESPSAGTSVNICFNGVLLLVSTGPAKILVPEVVGDTQAAATTAITGAGLTLGAVTSQASAVVASGNVISEAPSAGTSVNSGSAVNLVVSTGPVKVAVPNLVGDIQTDATTAIFEAGLTVGTVTTASSPTVASDNVISEAPGAGTSVNVGSAVNLVVSTGPAPTKTYVPNVVPDTQAAATTAITEAGLVVGSVTSQSSAVVASGDVISESPMAGLSVNIGSAVNLVISTGPATPVSLFTTAAISGSVANGYTVVITVTNFGTSTVNGLILTTATLRAFSGTPLPQTLGSLAAGASGTFTVNFPGVAGAAGAFIPLNYSGTCTGGSFSGSIRNAIPAA